MKSKLKYGPYHKLGNLDAREPDGTDNGDNDTGQVGDPYLRITEANYFSNGSDGTVAGSPFVPGPNGMALPVTPTGPFPGFTDDGNFFQNFIFPLEQPGGPLAGNLPQARAISDAVMALGPADQDHPNSFGVNEWFDFFGQALTHDVAEASTGNSGDLPLLIDGLPFPFGRTPGELDSNGVRQQLNEETAFLDLSFVYGNNQAREDLARADTSPGSGVQSAKLLMGIDGLLLPTIAQVAADSAINNNGAKTGSLEVLEIYTDPGFAGLPNPANIPLDGSQDGTFENLFYTGDNRANQQPPLIALQTIWAREHNYQVDKLTPYANKYGWTQDQLFEAARAITEAEWQHIIYEEYLPKLIGNHADYLLDAYKENHPDIPAGIINEWTTVAFRFGHDQSSNDYTLLNEDGSTNFQTTLGNAFTLAAAAQDVPGAGHNAADIDAWIRGLTSQFTQEIDGFVADGNRDALFGGLGSTVDLEAFDIQRGRDHGVGNYNLLREGLGLGTYSSFDDFAIANGYATDDARIVALKTVYSDTNGVEHIEWLDSIVGGLLEKKYYDSQLGETFTLLNAIQFEALREGDEFFYTNRFEHDYKLLAEIENTSFADILARNTDIDYLYRDAFEAHTRVSDTDGWIDGSEYAKDLAVGTDWGETIKTYGGDDDIYAGKGKDYIFAGGGDDWIWTGKGRDVVILDEYSGCDVVKDFETKYDKLDLTAYGIDTWKEVKKAMHNTKDGVVIQLDCDNEVTLVGVKVGQLSSKNFIYDDDYGYPVV